MELLIVISSIFVITITVKLLDNFLPLRVCPICAGVSGTWLWLLGGMMFDYLQTTNYQLLTAVLMGGSVVGIAYQAEKHFLRAGASQLLWKALFIPFGFATVFTLVNFYWLAAFAGIIALKLIALFFLEFSSGKASGISKISELSEVSEVSKLRKKKLEKEMEECC